MQSIFDFARTCAEICDHRREANVYAIKAEKHLNELRAGDRFAFGPFKDAQRMKRVARRLADMKAKRLPLVA